MKHTRRRCLGRTSLSVTSMGLGGAPLGNLFAELADTEAHDTVTRAWQEGIRLFDTAPFYGHGDRERRMGEVLREYDRDGFVLSTKVGRLLEPCAPDAVDKGQLAKTLPFQPVYDYSYDGVLRSFEESLQRITTPRIDILLAHDLDAWTHGGARCAHSGAHGRRLQGARGTAGSGGRRGHRCRPQRVAGV